MWSEGTEVIALYNFNGNPPEDLSFKRGEIMVIVAPTPVSETEYFFFLNFMINQNVALNGTWYYGDVRQSCKVECEW